MLRRPVTAAGWLFALSLAWGQTPVIVAAGAPPPPLPSEVATSGGDDETTSTFGVSGEGDIDASIAQTGSSPGPATHSGSGGGPVCTWTPATIANTAADGVDAAAGAGVNEQIASTDGRLGWIRDCRPGGLTFVWQAAVDPFDLIGAAADRAISQLPLPQPDMSPDATVGSVVNLGLWFAVADPGTVTARATLTNAWAQVTGTFDHVSIDPGTGDPDVVCDGFGVPYPDGANDPEQGPCGFTYTRSSPDDDPYQMTYTITYRLTWELSDGRSGPLGTSDRALPLDYNVDEIQTVGSS